MWTSFASSPSMSRVTGIPVHFETMSAISSAVTSSLRREFGPWSAAMAASCWVSRSWSSRCVPYLSCAARS